MPKSGTRLLFDLPAVLRIAEATVTGTEFSVPYGMTDLNEPVPALWWVKDAGSYLMGNAKRAEGETPAVVYAEGVRDDPTARELLGGDDFVEQLELLEANFTATGGTFLDLLRTSARWGHTHLVIETGGTNADGDEVMSIGTERRRS